MAVTDFFTGRYFANKFEKEQMINVLQNLHIFGGIIDFPKHFSNTSNDKQKHLKYLIFKTSFSRL